MLSYTEEKTEHPEVFALRYTTDLEENTYQLKRPVITSYVQVEILEMHVSGHDSGGSFEFIGSPCAVREKSLTQQTTYPRVIAERCDATSEFFPEISPIEEGEKFIVVCPWRCLESLEGHVYGDSDYTPTSTLCATGVHAGVCTPAAGEEVQERAESEEGAGAGAAKKKKRRCEFVVTVGEAKPFFRGKTSFGVTSLPHGPAEASIRLSDIRSLQTATGVTQKGLGAPVRFDITFGNKAALPEEREDSERVVSATKEFVLRVG